MKTFKLTAYVQVADLEEGEQERALADGAYVEEADTDSALLYALDALRCWGGQRHRADPFFYPDVVVSEVKLLKRNPTLPSNDEDEA